METQRIREIVDKYLIDESFIIPEIKELVGQKYYDDAIEGLAHMVADFGKTLPEEALNDPELFSQYMEKYFMVSDSFFRYDSNTQYAFKPNDQKSLYVSFIERLSIKPGEKGYSLQGLSKPQNKELNKLLAHTFFPLVNGVQEKGSYNADSPRRAICSGYAQLGCILAECFGFEATPVAAHVLNEDGTEAYPYAHYLLKVSKDGKEALVDPQSATTAYRKATTGIELTPEMDTSEYQKKAIDSVNGAHAHMTFIMTSGTTHEKLDTFNAERFIQGGLGANVGYLVTVSMSDERLANCTFKTNPEGSIKMKEIAPPTDSNQY